MAIIIRRREFIMLAGGAAAWPLAAGAQSGSVRRIGVLMNAAATDTDAQARVAAFVQGLRALGWVEGQNLRIDVRWNAGEAELARTYAAQLIGLMPDVILAASTTNLTVVRQATSTVPVVFVQVSDPVAQGIVPTLARPGGNITGFTSFEYSMGGKWLDLLKQMSPSLARVAIMFNPQHPQSAFWSSSLEAAGPSLGVAVMAAPVNDTAEIERSIGRLASAPNSGLVVPTDAFLGLHSKLIVESAARHGLPSIYATADYLAHGGLMYYGYDFAGQFRQAAVYVDRILKGANPGDLPIQAPTKFELKINLKAAKALGIEVPIGLMLRADELVE